MIARATAIASITALLILAATLQRSGAISPPCPGTKSLAELQQEWHEVHHMWPR
jgi:hypothetical protein